MSEVVHTVEQGDVQDYINQRGKVVIKFTAPAWCRPCQQFAPHFEAAAKGDQESTTFLAVDVDNAPWAMTDYGVQGVPTVMLYEDGEYVKNLQERTAIKLLNEINS